MKNSWYVLTGGPSAGKTTLIKELEAKGHKVVHETARAYIDKQIAKGLTIEDIRKDELSLQKEILKMKIDIEKELDAHELIFFDRAIPDTHAYYRFKGFDPDIDEELQIALKSASYGKIFFLEMLPYVQDYARIESPEEASEIHMLLRETYEKTPHPIIHVPVLPIEERLEFILQSI